MDIQVRDVTAFAEAQHLNITRWYKDEVQSGAAENRKQLKKLLRDCGKGVVGTIVVPTLDRLSRDLRIAENLFWQFDRLGIRVFIADMPYYDSSNRRDVLIRQIREAIAEDNRKEIIERLWKGRLERIRKGRPPGGNTPYGYRRVGKRLIENQDESGVVRVIFDLAAIPLSSAEIAHQLQGNGVSQRNGSNWSARQVRAVLSRRPLYMDGQIRYGDAEGRSDNLVLIKRKDVPYEDNVEVGAAL